jgi:hypothetical protein
MLLGSALLWALAALLGLLAITLLALLFLPVDLTLRVAPALQAPDWAGDLDGAVRWLARLHWGGPLLRAEWEGEYLEIVRAECRMFGVRMRPVRRRGAPGAEAQAKPKGRPMGKPLEPELWLACLEEFGRFFGKAVEELGLRVSGRLTYGFSDPALTGWLEGVRWALDLPSPLELEPEFRGACLTGAVEARGRTYGYKLALAALRALQNPVIRKRLVRRGA